MQNENKEYLNKLHAELLIIMDEIDRVCKKNNLRYYLVGGSLLGAVRHKGFIPWDDDLDIAMPREDLNKLLEISASVLSPNYYVKWYQDDPRYWNPFPKICKRGTLFDENKEEWEKTGLFIDIFPLDLSPAYCKNLYYRKVISKKINGFIKAKYTSKTNIKNFFQRLLVTFIP